ncbi:MAG: anaerobic glycerol-3-phosphate dehydrogenase subunit GlpB [Candidatus Thorarchaeota archaeon]|jgi:glycerol-3-phosphate dehydrogenase subunit B
MDLDADLLVIGGGMAGLVAGTVAAESGLKTILIQKGQGATVYSSGAVDVIGYLPEASMAFTNPEEGLAAIAGLYPLHPYSVIGYGEEIPPEDVVDAIIKRTRASVDWLKAHLDGTSATLIGDFSSNINPITVLGTTKPTCLIQRTMDSGNIEEQEDSTLLFVGIYGHPDFNSTTTAKTYLEDRIAMGVPPRKVVHCAIRLAPFGNTYNLSGIELARHLDHNEGLNELVEQLKVHVEKVGATHVAIPPILGIQNTLNNHSVLKQALGAHVFELLGFPPSVPGLRLQLALERIYREAGGKLLVGHEAVSYKMGKDQVESVTAKAPRRRIDVNAKAFILATGKFIGGGLAGNENGIRETTFDMMTVTGSYHSAADLLPSKSTNRISITPEGQPLYSTGLTVDPNFRPIQEEGVEWARNLYAAGSVLAGYNYSVEKSGLGVALTSGFSAAQSAISHLKEVSK